MRRLMDKRTQLGFEKDGLFADPQFVDAEKNDFRLKSSSPALVLGFRQWDYSVSGRKRKGCANDK